MTTKFVARMLGMLAVAFSFLITEPSQAQSRLPIERLMRAMQARWKEVSNQAGAPGVQAHQFDPYNQPAIDWEVDSLQGPEFPRDGFFDAKTDEQKLRVVRDAWLTYQPYRFYLKSGAAPTSFTQDSTAFLDEHSGLGAYHFEAEDFDDLHLNDSFPTSPTSTELETWFDNLETGINRLNAHFRDLTDGRLEGTPPHGPSSSILGTGVYSRHGESDGETDCGLSRLHACVDANAAGGSLQSNNSRGARVAGTVLQVPTAFSPATGPWSTAAHLELKTGVVRTDLRTANDRAHTGNAYIYFCAYEERDGLGHLGTEFPPPAQASSLVKYPWSDDPARFVLWKWRGDIPIGAIWQEPLIGTRTTPPNYNALQFLETTNCVLWSEDCSKYLESKGWFVGIHPDDMKCPSAYGPRSAVYPSYLKVLIIQLFWDLTPDDDDEVNETPLPDLEDPAPSILPKLQGNVPPPAKKKKKDCDEKQNPKTGKPIEVATGDKIEATIDLAIATTGGSFEILRGYTSRLGVHGSNEGYGLVGPHWNLSVFRRIQVTRDSSGDATDLTLGDIDTGGQWYFEPDSSEAGAFKTEGPSTQRLRQVHISSDNIDVWRLTEPGVGETDYYCKTATNSVPAGLDGLIRCERDVYGNEDRYRYQLYRVDGGGSSSQTARLNRIEVGCQTSSDVPDAIVSFSWDLSASSTASDAVRGRLRSITALRYIDRTNLALGTVTTHKVEYTYKNSGDDGQAAHDDVGSAGDLIQVTHAERVDRVVSYFDLNKSIKSEVAPDLSNEAFVEPFRCRVTQYRYHDGNTRTSSTDERLATAGAAHQLKAVVLPEQVEYLTQQRGENDVRLCADAVLKLADSATPYSGAPTGHLVTDYFAKLVSYETTGSRRAVTEYLQTAVGCCGNASQGVKQTLAYSSNSTGPAAEVSEWVRSSSSGWDLFRTIEYQAELKGATQTPYLHSMTIVEPGTSGREWTWSYTYDSNANLLKEITPAANASGGVSGLVNVHVYNSENRLTETRIADGVSSSGDLVARTTYSTVAGQTHLPVKIERFASASSVTADTTETVLITYGFYSGTDVGRPGAVDAIAWEREQIEAELETENGPGSSTTYDRYELFDLRGQNTWTRTPDNALIFRRFDSSPTPTGAAFGTGVILKEVANANPASPGGETAEALVASNYPGLGSTSGWGGLTGGEETTSYEIDYLGRCQIVTPPNAVKRYFLREMRPNDLRPGPRYYSEVSFGHYLPLPYYVPVHFDGPVTVTWSNAGGRTIRTSQFALADSIPNYSGTSEHYLVALKDYPETGVRELSRQSTEHALSGLATSSRVWEWIDRPVPVVHQTDFTYDSMGRRLTTRDPDGTITKVSSYDVLGRALEIQVGTDSGSPGNMRTVSSTYYDSSSAGVQGVGNGLVTSMVLYTGETAALLASDARTTVNTYDHRDRLISVSEPASGGKRQTTTFGYDNLDRTIEKSLFDDVGTSATCGLYVQYLYSQRGLEFRKRVAIDPESPSTFLETNSWFDAVGRTIETWAPNSPAVKTTYDSLGRTVASYITDRGGDPLPGASGNYAHALTLTDDIVLEQSATSYSDGVGSDVPNVTSPRAWLGKPVLITTLQRLHDYSGTGALSASNAVATYVGLWYDFAGRLTHTVDFGTNDTGTTAGAFKANTSAPVWPVYSAEPTSEPVFSEYSTARLVTSTTYDERGLVSTSTDSGNKTSRSFYDDMNRQFAVAESYVGGTPFQWYDDEWHVSGASPTADTNRLTRYEFNGAGAVVRQFVYTGSSNVQVTEYIYGTTAPSGAASNSSQSLIASNALIAEVRYPSPSTGLPDPSDNSLKVRYAYNALGELRSMIDQNGTTHEYHRDAFGRVLSDIVTQFGTTPPIDSAIKRIDASYDGFGRTEYVTSYSDTVGTEVANQVLMMYTKLWQIRSIYQENHGAVQLAGTGEDPAPAGTTGLVRYFYQTAPVGSGNFTRKNLVVYPYGDWCSYTYGSASSVDDRISRLKAIDFLQQTGGSVEAGLAQYQYVGLNTPVVVDYPYVDIQLDRTVQANGTRGTAASGEYRGLDRFGRVVRQDWVDGAFNAQSPVAAVPNRPQIVSEGYTYDAGSNRTSRRDLRPGAKHANRDFAFEYDKLNRLTKVNRGVVDSSGAIVTHGVGGQSWGLDALGNWTTFKSDVDGNGDFEDTIDLSEARTHNAANQITERVPDTSGPTLPFTYDGAGNVLNIGRDTGITRVLTHDAWNRLVYSQDNAVGPPIGIGMLTRNTYNGLHWRIIADNSQLGGQVREMFYNASWQMIEEHVIQGGEFESTPLYTIQEFWGDRYIDDAVARRRIPVEDVEAARIYFHLTDVQFSTVAMVDDTGTLVERVEYDAYGMAHHKPRGDIDGDGDYDGADFNAVLNTGELYIGDEDYDPDLDLNRNGYIFSEEELGSVPNAPIAALPAGEISSAAGPDNVFGFNGYVFDRSTKWYGVRFRWYEPGLGRWLERDPVGYIDSANLMEAVGSAPTVSTDPMGLFEEGGHYYTTFLVARCVGLSLPESLRLATYSQMPDEVSWLDARALFEKSAKNGIYGQLTEGTGGGRAGMKSANRAMKAHDEWMRRVHNWIHSLHGGNQNAVNCRRKCSADLIKSGGLEPWQRGLLIHALQDSYAHVRNAADGSEEAYPPGWGHAKDSLNGNCPDCIGSKGFHHSQAIMALAQALGASPLRAARCSSLIRAGLPFYSGNDDESKDAVRKALKSKAIGLGHPSRWEFPEDLDMDTTNRLFPRPTRKEVDDLMKLIERKCGSKR